MERVKVNSNAIITNSQGKFLLIKIKGGHFKGGLCIPGGGVIPGELSHVAAKREVLEETGISVDSDFTPFGFCELMNDEIRQHKIVMLSHATAEGVPKETEEGEAGWYTYEEAESNMLAFSKEAIRIWREKQIHFKLTGNEVDFRRINLDE